MALEDYKTKRNFQRTPEPEGDPQRTPDPEGGQGNGSLHFVVQKHQASHLHYDLRLEAGGVLKSWAVPKGPSLNPEGKHLAMMVEDHPFDYRTFEGIIPKGNYGAGSVMVWDEGTYEPLQTAGDRQHDENLVKRGIHEGHITFILHGQKLNGEFALVKIKNSDDENAWLLIKAAKDEFASQTDITKKDRSVVTGRTIEEIAEAKPITKFHLDLDDTPKAALPTDPRPMLATLGDEPFDDPEWRYEIKWDGYRILASVANGKVKLISRRGQDYTDVFHPVAIELEQLHLSALIDGEVVVVDLDGKSNFQMLQNYLRTQTGQLVYYTFDLPYFDGHNLTSLPLAHRQEILRRILPQGSHLKLSEAVVGEGKALFEQAKLQGLEGLIAKRSDSLYSYGRRTRDWIKLKTRKRQEAVIAGYTLPRSGRQYFGSLVAGVYQGERLVYAGHVGTGFDEATLKDLHTRLQPLRTGKCPIDPEPKTNEPAIWVRPELVCEIEFAEWTEDGQMRQPSFMGLREDKAATDVIRELPAVNNPNQAPNPKPSNPPNTSQNPREAISLKLNGKTVRFTHPDKIFWADEGITKGDLLNYYQTIAGTILPHLKDRPESLNRFPHGIQDNSFYQKNLEDHPAWAKTIAIRSDSENREINYLLCQDEATLAYMINLGCIDLNPWNSRTGRLSNPDWCVLDLDPEDIPFDAVVETAQAAHAVLDELKVPSYPKTSGATGLHIYIPLGAKYDYDQAKTFCQLIANLVHTRLPNITSIERSPKKRQQRVYLDYLQNRRGQTLASAYSVRPRPGATVSIPLHWDEVTPGLHPGQFTIKNTPGRLAQTGDLFKPVLGPGINLAEVLKNLGAA